VERLTSSCNVCVEMKGILPMVDQWQDVARLHIPSANNKHSLHSAGMFQFIFTAIQNYLNIIQSLTLA